jgi:hypothetical protein
MIMDIASIIKEDRLLRTMLRISNSESSKSAKGVGAVFICLFFCPFSLGHCVFWSSSMYGFWLPLWYLQTPFGHCVVCPSIFGFLFPFGFFKLFLFKVDCFENQNIVVNTLIIIFSVLNKKNMLQYENFQG